MWWEPPQPGLVKLNVDGSCNSRGEIGVGGLIRDDKSNWLVGLSFNDGQGDVLFAELFAIYHGITLVLQLGHSRAKFGYYSIVVSNKRVRVSWIQFVTAQD